MLKAASRNSSVINGRAIRVEMSQNTEDSVPGMRTSLS